MKKMKSLWFCGVFFPYKFIFQKDSQYEWKLDKPIQRGMVCSKQIHKSVDAVFLWFIFKIGTVHYRKMDCVVPEILTVVEALALKTSFRWSGMLLKQRLAQCQLNQISWKKPKANQYHCFSEMPGLFFPNFDLVWCFLITLIQDP